MYYPELEKQILVRGVRKSVIAAAIGCTQKTLRKKMNGESRFTWEEVSVLNNRFFPDMRPETLMRKE